MNLKKELKQNMADYCMRGTRRLITYAIAQGLNMSVDRQRIASAIGIPVIHLAGVGRDPSSYISPKYNEAQAQSLVNILGAADTDTVTTNTGQEVVG